LFDIFAARPVSGGIYMIESSMDISQQSIRDLRFKIAGWLSICLGILEIPLFISSLVFRSDPFLKPLFLFLIFTPLIFFRWIGTVYVLIQFRRLLNERYDFFKADVIITLQIIISIIIGVKDILMAYIEALFPLSDVAGTLGLVLYIFSLLVGGAIGIFLGARLLAIREDSYGSLRTWAIITIIASSCFVSIILTPIGLALYLLNGIILGVIFLKAAEAEAQVDFV
jgi:hypothetical protein